MNKNNKAFTDDINILREKYELPLNTDFDINSKEEVFEQRNKFLTSGTLTGCMFFFVEVKEVADKYHIKSDEYEALLDYIIFDI